MCQGNIFYTTAPSPASITDTRMDPCFPLVYAKLLTAEIKIYQTGGLWEF